MDEIGGWVNLPDDLVAIVGDAEPMPVVEGGREHFAWWTDKAVVADCAFCRDDVCVQRIEWAEHWESFLVVHNHRTREFD